MVTKSDFPDKFRPGTNWKKPGVLLSPVPLNSIKIMLKVKSANEIGINDIVETKESDNATSDLYVATKAADESLVRLFYVADTEHNRRVLAADNGEDSYSGLNKATAQFAKGSIIEAYYLIPGMIISAKFVDSSTVKSGVIVTSGDNGKLKAGTTGALGRILGQFESTAALRWGSVLITH